MVTNFRKTKIVCTIGPSSWTKEKLEELAKAGMDIARLNFSHGTQDEKSDQIKHIREVSQKLNKPIAILADLSGPKLRLGKLAGVLELKKSQDLKLSVDPSSEDEIPLQFDLSPFIKKDQRIFLNDGLVELKVNSVKGKTILTTVQNEGWISSNKGVNVPDTEISESTFTPKDIDDAKFAISKEVDYIALSFIQKAADLKHARSLINKAKSNIKIIVKVEKKKATEDLENIVKATDGIMVARGDLGIEIPPQEVPIIQQKLIHLSRQAHKPVIVATQMLESMVENPRPTRAEVSDVANAVLSQVDAVMLSAESANGKYPVEAVSIMRDTILSVEQHADFKHYIRINWEKIEEEYITSSAITSSASNLAYRIGAKLIVVATASGKTARVLSSFRPDSNIIAITHDDQTRNQLGLVWGIKPYIVKANLSTESFWNQCLEQVRKSSLAFKGDKIVIITGSKTGISGGTDSVKVATI